MAIKSAYREKPVETPNIEIKDEPPQPSESVKINFDTGKAEPAVAVVSADQYPELDEATLVLQKQIADLKKSEELQKQYALHVAAARAQPPTREQKIQMWSQQGMTPADLRFLQQNPAMIDAHDLTRLASDEAAQHHQRDTDAHRAATLEAFHRLQGQQAQAPASTPAFFEPSEPPRAPAAPDRAAMYSAPVSRTAPPGGYREPSPRQVRLSPAEQQIAAASGISDTEYAKNKLRMLRERAAGERE